MSFWELALQTMPQLLHGLRNSLVLTSISICLGIVLGLVLALTKVYGRGPLRWLAISYIGLFRGTPLITQLFIIYFGLSSVGLVLSPFVSAILGLGLNSAAYQAEYFRGSILAIEPGELLGARALGMSRIKTIRCIVLPQILRLVIPSWSNELIYLIKYSSLAYLIQFPELLFQTRYIASRNFRMFEMFVIAGFLYLGVVLIVSYILKKLEIRLRIPGLGVGSGNYG
jgi:polar amino acid transport system permease protein